MRKAKEFEESLIQSALANVYAFHKKKVPESAYKDLSSYVKDLRLSIKKHSTPVLEDASIALFAGSYVKKALYSATEWLVKPTSTIQLFYDLRKKVAPSIKKSFSLHLRYKISSLLSSYVGTFVCGNLYPFDPRCHAKNVGGIMMEEIIKTSLKRRLSWLVGPTPTVGNHISPEAEAAVAGLERGSSCFPYKKWIYINLQSTHHLSEKGRSEALFSFSKQHKGAFSFASISVDNPLYVAKDRSSCSVLKQKMVLLEQLKKACYGEESFYAFSLLDEDRDTFFRIVLAVLEEAYRISNEISHRPAAVFHELVVLGLVRAWHGFCLRQAEGDAMATIACRECADRGGSVNAAFVWAFSEKNEQDTAVSVQTVLWGRPLLACMRLNEHCRSRGFCALVENFQPSDMKKYTEFCFSLGFGAFVSHTYEY